MPESHDADWLAALDAAVRAAPDLADAAEEPVVIVQRVLHQDGTVTAYHLVLGPGPARVGPGEPDVADLTLIATEAAAREIRAGRRTAQDCLADGGLRVRGNPEVLTRRAPVLARVGSLLGR